MITRLLEWTGIPLALGGMDLFITVYLPMLYCTLCVMWLGYAWGALPAFLSTFLVSLLGGVPLPWIVLFSFANPVGLAVFALAYRAIPIRTDLRSLAAFLFFMLTAFVSSLVGSSGSFVWGYTNQVGFSDLMPVWQGWWLGGFLQTMVFNAPLLLVAGPMVERWKTKNGLGTPVAETLSRRGLLVAFIVVVGALTGYVILVRYFTLLQLDVALAGVAASDGALYDAILRSFEGMSLIHWVTLLLIASTGIFGYQVVLHWTAALRASTDALTRLNLQLTDEIAERKRVEAQLQENATQLNEANDSKDRFFSIISHDLRNLLASVLTVSRTLTEDFDKLDRDTLYEFLTLLNTSTEDLFELLDNLLIWSRLQTGTMRHRPEWFDLAVLIHGITDLLNSHAVEKEIHLQVNVPPLTHTWADPNMIRSAVLNLLSNAIKFTRPGGAVVLSVTKKDKRLCVEVRDTGVGMDEEQLRHLFRIDTAFSTPGTANEKGSGLGLILCKEMISHHEDDLAVASRLGVGTTFTFTLPAHRPAVPVEPAAH